MPYVECGAASNKPLSVRRFLRLTHEFRLAPRSHPGQTPPVPRTFNTAGPCDPARNYMLPPVARLPEARALVEEGLYFVLHAPRQTGKTTLLRTLAAELTASGRFAAVTASCEAGSAAGDDYEAAQRAILADLRRRAEEALRFERVLARPARQAASSYQHPT